MFQQISPNMLKTYELCPKKFYLRYVKNISMPVNDEIFELGKNIHALASYYLRKENIDKMEKALSLKEAEIWNYLKSNIYFSFNVIGTEYNLAFKFDDIFLGGRLDALVKDEQGRYYILDYKTGTMPKNAKSDYQTIIYMFAVKEFFKTDNVSFIYIDLKNKDYFKFDYSKELENEYSNKLKKILNKIKIKDFEAQNEDCKCEYSIICY